ncbi:MAG: hypothetical protein IE933_04690 [Sphingomonadales bacterium]|nr:hypothetical protein [Sphingomonadales bacterium]MBD3772970.1 hypothetical protein [Paracoccaceae bacterium]
MAAASMLALVMMAQAPAPAVDVAYEQLNEGRNVAAIAAIELNTDLDENDPARLINLGIAYARQGDRTRARELFVAAERSPERVDLETAGGKWVDSRDLARQALAMLDQGEFANPSRMSMR